MLIYIVAGCGDVQQDNIQPIKVLPTAVKPMQPKNKTNPRFPSICHKAKSDLLLFLVLVPRHSNFTFVSIGRSRTSVDLAVPKKLGDLPQFHRPSFDCLCPPRSAPWPIPNSSSPVKLASTKRCGGLCRAATAAATTSGRGGHRRWPLVQSCYLRASPAWYNCTV